MNTHKIELEISGPTALWSRPDTMPNPVSYVAPTYGAVKGIFESILRWKNVNIRPVKCEICAPVQFHRYAFNYGGPLRKSGQIAKKVSLQIFAQVLINVCYRVYAEVEYFSEADKKIPPDTPNLTNHPQHAYADRFMRRLEKGRWFYTPCLGWKEFVPDYVGPFRSGTTKCTTENHKIPAFLKMSFDQPQNGRRGQASFLKNVEVKNGELEYKDGENQYA